MMKKMDKLSDSRLESYKKVGTFSVFLVVFLLQVAFVFIDVQVLEKIFPNVSTWWIKILYSIVNIILFSGLYIWIFNIAIRIENCHWIRENPRLYIKGKWLHIHAKKRLRIGVVEIRQEYDHFEARGRNFSYLGAKDNHITNWTYKVAIVKEDKTNCDYLGCYSATKKSNETQDGMHMLTVAQTDEKTGYPIYLQGGFADTFKVNEGDEKPPIVNNHCGDLYLYRMSDKLEKYLYGNGGDIERKVVELCKHPEFQDEPFVKAYKKYMDDYELW